MTDLVKALESMNGMTPELRRLLDEAKARGPMTPKQAYDQRVSWIWGQLPEESKQTIEDVKAQLALMGIVDPERGAPDIGHVLTVVNMLLEDVAEEPGRLVRAQEIAERDITPLLDGTTLYREVPVTGETPRTDAHLSHLNLPDGRKVGIPDQTVELLRQLERELAHMAALLAGQLRYNEANPLPASHEAALNVHSDEEACRNLAQRMLGHWNETPEMLLGFLQLLLRTRPAEQPTPPEGYRHELVKVGTDSKGFTTSSTLSGDPAVKRAESAPSSTREIGVDGFSDHHKREVRKHWDYLVRKYADMPPRLDTSNAVANVINDASNLAAGIRRYAPTTLSEFVHADEATRERIGAGVVAGAIERQNAGVSSKAAPVAWVAYMVGCTGAHVEVAAGTELKAGEKLYAAPPSATVTREIEVQRATLKNLQGVFSGEAPDRPRDRYARSVIQEILNNMPGGVCAASDGGAENV